MTHTTELTLFSRCLEFTKVALYREYYTAARRYEFYFRAVKTIFYERAQRVSKILFSTTSGHHYLCHSKTQNNEAIRY